MSTPETQEVLERYAAAFRAHIQQRGQALPRQAGYSGSLGGVFLPPDVVDDMEHVISDAFEQVEQVEQDEKLDE
ncbi:MAG TPA: hypothetical protein VKQ36_16380 [Ktedonobacterales bacterium]|nr:hypothetical protein [Ktedonobacterales bacterium]